jgi:chromosome segregation ATPase
VQSLDLSKARTCSRAMVVAQGAHTAELEVDNTRLQSELEQDHQALAEANAVRSSLSTNRTELERECAGLCTTVDTFKQEKAKVMAARETDVAAEQKKFWDYRLGHHRKLHEFCVNLERAMNGIGVRCLPYP